MLNVDTIKNGLVIDHICAGFGPKIFNWLGLEKTNFTTALVMNVPSKTMQKKDIIKVDNIINIDFSVLGFIDPNITVNVIKDEKIVKKIKMELPYSVENVIKCKNPRCITVTEHYASHMFRLVDKSKALYCCEYCDTMVKAGPQQETYDLFDQK